MSPTLFPRPRRLELGDGPGAPWYAPVTAEVDDSLPAQGYALSTGPDGVRIRHRDSPGLRYALQTLDQLRRAPEYPSRAVTVEDWPDFAVRGFMLDISRDRVPTRRTLARWVELLTLARINQFELYIEHTFAYSGQQAVWQDAAPLTPDDIRWLDGVCTAAGITLVPNQNTLGHWERWLAHDAHRGRAENVDGFDFGGTHRPPSTLAPTEDNAEFVGRILDELAACYRARRINIGADEPWELGTGMSRERAAQVGLGTVYFDYVSTVMRRWLDRGYLVEFWADIFGDYPELMGRVPEGAVPVVWQYDAPSAIAAVIDDPSGLELNRWKRLGLDPERLRRGFRDRAKLLIEAGVPFWVAPGTGTWNSLVGRTGNAVENMIDAAEVGLEFGATGYLNTAWGDNGMYDPPSVAFGPVLYGGAVSWGLAANRDLDLAALLNETVLLDPTGCSGQALERAGRISDALRVPMLNASPLARALLAPDLGAGGPTPEGPALDDAAREIADCIELLRLAEPACADGDVVVREVTQALRLAAFAVGLLQAGPVASRIERSAARRLLRELDDLVTEQRACWLLRSRPGGLDDSIARLAPLRHALLHAATA